VSGPKLEEHVGGVNEEKELITICKSCLRRLNAQKLPQYSLANNLAWLPRPAVLLNLTFLELKLVQLFRTSLYVVELHTTWSDEPIKRSIINDNVTIRERPFQLHLRGNVSAFCQDTPSLEAIWPMSPENLADLVQVVLISPFKPSENDKSLLKTLGVRRDVVRAALEYMLQDPTMRSIWSAHTGRPASEWRINEDNLNRYPQNGVPAAVFNAITITDNAKAAAQERSGYAKEDIEAGSSTDSADDDVPLRYSGLVDVKASGIAGEALRHVLTNSVQSRKSAKSGHAPKPGKTAAKLKAKAFGKRLLLLASIVRVLTYEIFSSYCSII
jgi:hypothetical protein